MKNLPLPHIECKDLTVAYGDRIVMQNLNFTINRGDVFVIMGGSGCGKSTLLKVLIGLKRPSKGTQLFNGVDFWNASKKERNVIMQKTGVLYQSGALWSSMTLSENLALPLQHYTTLSDSEIKDMVDLKLNLVGLAGFQNFYPSEISGGMKKRAGLARALALDPDIVFFDEPSAGLDPVSARLLDDLILEIQRSLNTTIVIVTHELASIFAIGTNSIYLDIEARTAIGYGNPNDLLKHSDNPKILNFLTRGEQGH